MSKTIVNIIIWVTIHPFTVSVLWSGTQRYLQVAHYADKTRTSVRYINVSTLQATSVQQVFVVRARGNFSAIGRSSNSRLWLGHWHCDVRNRLAGVCSLPTVMCLREAAGFRISWWIVIVGGWWFAFVRLCCPGGAVFFCLVAN